MSTPSSGARSPSVPSSPTLHRGQACITCRRKKMRCDGARPFCGQCALTRNPEHCEYTDRQGRTQTEILEERLHQLKLRIQELESPMDRSSPIYLHYPYRSSGTSTHKSVSSSRQSTADFAEASIRLPQGGFNEQLNVGTQAPTLQMFSPENVSTQVQASTSPAPLLTATKTSIGRGELQPFLSDEIFPTLLDIFLSHSSRLGFCLHIPRFRQRIAATSPSNRAVSNRPHDALLSTISLWAICLSRSHWTGSGVAEAEQHILAHALQSVPAALANASISLGTGGSSSARVDFIQAEVLLALYFFCEGRMLEGRYHASAAMSAAVSWRLHDNRGAYTGQRTRTPCSGAAGAGGSMAGLSLSMSSMEMQQPRDGIELGERINVFWSAYVLDRCWSVAMDSPPVLMYEGGDAGRGFTITTPLPRSLDLYERESVQTVANNAQERPLSYYLSEEADYTHLGITHLPSLKVIAAALFGNATNVVGRRTEHPAGDSDLLSRAASLERIIIRFTDRLSHIATDLDRQSNVSNLASKKRELVVARSVALAAMIQLHNRFVSANDGGSAPKTPTPSHRPHTTQVSSSDSNISKRSAALCTQAAQKVADVAGGLTMEDVEYLDSIIGVAWLTASRILLRDRQNDRPLQAIGPSQGDKAKGKGAIGGGAKTARSATFMSLAEGDQQQRLNQIVELMVKLGETCPVMALQATTIEEFLSFQTTSFA